MNQNCTSSDFCCVINPPLFLTNIKVLQHKELVWGLHNYNLKKKIFLRKNIIYELDFTVGLIFVQVDLSFPGLVYPTVTDIKFPICGQQSFIILGFGLLGCVS